MASDDVDQITLNAIEARHGELRAQIRQTPVVALESPEVRDLLGGGSVVLKLECFQHTGTFKARGALSNARAIPKDTRAAGITAASAGNHAIAAAWAARVCGLSAKVVMQNNANPFRVQRARNEGSEVILRDPGAATFAEAERLATEEARTFIHPFDGIDTILGTAGVGLELMGRVPDLDAVVVSVGGGGLISGVAAATKLINPGCQVYGVEPQGADAMSRSLMLGAPVTLENVDTIADSLGPPMALPLGYMMCAAYVDAIVTVSDDEICAGMVVLQQEAKLAVEPAAGAAIAGVLGPLARRLQGKRVGVVVCGANIDAATYSAQLVRGEAHLRLVSNS
ncbi:pyridoxal-phosphate dependent enzyme [Sulfitobacter sp. F26204]|uniref:pyridoxal-phosphate dependent enzyme n=1 Tax=Sulfitobacter sp. F26204 TaxID=2996014 RepID=UPI00225E3831|nr:pyridoxal-phosphate dependent enzyme [Sulfitobacter sp. F26204]MCX7558186.1 pyridoxal-phosphate dependent enzyme [Sulfitobacter sp. F26204]